MQCEMEIKPSLLNGLLYVTLLLKQEPGTERKEVELGVVVPQKRIIQTQTCKDACSLEINMLSSEKSLLFLMK